MATLNYDQAADELNAAIKAFGPIAIGGGTRQAAAEVKVAWYRYAGMSERRQGIKARVRTQWYWLFDSQIEGMLDRARRIAASA